MKHWVYLFLFTLLPGTSFAVVTPPALGAASTFALFTAVGAFDNVGPSIVKGDIGTNAGAFSGFPLGVVTGDIHVGDTYSTQAATDVQNAFSQLAAIPCVVPLGGLGGPPGNPQILTPNAYCLGGQTTFAGQLILDAQGDANAVFFIRVSGAMTTGEGSTVTLVNGASASNVYWQVTGRVDLGRNSVFQGTLVVDGAINLVEGAQLTGRGLSRAGAITMDTNLVTLPGASAVPTSTNWLGSAVGTLAARQNWFAPANWSNGVPTAALNATINSGRPSYPVLTTGTATTNNLTLGTAASLTQNGGTLEISGNFANSGTLTTGGGTVALVGSTMQNVGGTSISRFWNLNVGLAGATLTGTAQMQRVLTLTGSLNTNERPFTLLSSATGTAMAVNAGGAVVGATTVQRFITPGTAPGLGYRQLSSPVTNTNVADLTVAGPNGFTPVVNAEYNAVATYPAVIAPFPTVFGFDETRFPTSPIFEQGYFSPTTLADPLVPGKGYSVYMRPLTPDFVGTLGNGDLTQPLSKTGNFTGGTQKSGWHLLGNPFPSPLDWDLVAIPAGMSNSVSVFKSTGGNNGTYLTRAGGVGSLPNGEIAMASGFFVRVTGAEPVVFTLPNAARTTTYSNPIRYRTAPESRPLVALTLRAVSAPAELHDEATLYFQAGATAALDAAFDGEKPAHNIGVPTLVSLTAQNDELAVNGLSAADLAAGTTVRLLLDLPQAGAYTLAVGQLANLTGAVLLDQLTGTRYELTAQTTVTFTAARAGAVADRFALVFGQRVAATAPLTAAAPRLALYPNPTNGHAVRLTADQTAGNALVELLDATGRRVQTTRTAADGTATLSVAGLKTGIYMVRVGAATQRLLVD